MTWTAVRNFGTVKYFNISYVVMIGVPVLATIYQAIQSKWLNSHITFVFPSTLKWLYAASIAYAFGIALYQIFCPPEVKTAQTIDEYVHIFKELYERALPDKKYNIVLTNLDSLQKDSSDRLVALHEKLFTTLQDSTQRQVTQTEYDGLIELLYPSCVQRYLIKDYSEKVKSRTIAIWASALLYFTGTGIMLYLIFCRAYLVFSV